MRPWGPTGLSQCVPAAGSGAHRTACGTSAQPSGPAARTPPLVVHDEHLRNSVVAPVITSGHGSGRRASTGHRLPRPPGPGGAGSSACRSSDAVGAGVGADGAEGRVAPVAVSPRGACPLPPETTGLSTDTCSPLASALAEVLVLSSRKTMRSLTMFQLEVVLSMPGPPRRRLVHRLGPRHARRRARGLCLAWCGGAAPGPSTAPAEQEHLEQAPSDAAAARPRRPGPSWRARAALLAGPCGELLWPSGQGRGARCRRRSPPLVVPARRRRPR